MDRRSSDISRDQAESKLGEMQMKDKRSVLCLCPCIKNECKYIADASFDANDVHEKEKPCLPDHLCNKRD